MRQPAMRPPGGVRRFAAAGPAAICLALAGCGPGLTALPCDGDARLCPDAADLPVAAAGGGGAGTAGGAGVATAGSVPGPACPPGAFDAPSESLACNPLTETRPERTGLEGRPANSASTEAVRLRMESTAIASELSRLPPGAESQQERRRLEREQQRIDNRVRTLETPWLRVPPPGVSY